MVLCFQVFERGELIWDSTVKYYVSRALGVRSYSNIQGTFREQSGNKQSGNSRGTLRETFVLFYASSHPWYSTSVDELLYIIQILSTPHMRARACAHIHTQIRLRGAPYPFPFEPHYVLWRPLCSGFNGFQYTQVTAGLGRLLLLQREKNICLITSYCTRLIG